MIFPVLVNAFQEGQYGFMRDNMDSRGPIRIQEGQNGFIMANTDLSMDFRKANTNRVCIFGGPIPKPVRKIPHTGDKASLDRCG